MVKWFYKSIKNFLEGTGVKNKAYDSDLDGVFDVSAIPGHKSTHEYGGSDEISNNDILFRLYDFLTNFWFQQTWGEGTLDYGSAGSGSVVWAGDTVKLDTGATADSYAWIRHWATGLRVWPSWNYKRYWGVRVEWGANTGQNIHIVTGLSPDTGPTNTYPHFGFKVIDGDLYGTVGDGTNEAELDLGVTVNPGDRDTLEAIYTPGQEVRFYVNRSDKGAITSVLPAGENPSNLLRASIHNTEAASKYLKIFEIRVLELEP